MSARKTEIACQTPQGKDLLVMKKIKRILSLVCAAALLLTVAGCSAGNQADTDAVIAAIDKFRACKSFTLVQQTEIEESVTVEGMEYSYSGLTEMEMSLVSEPELSVMTVRSMTQVFDGEESFQSAYSYLIPENGGHTEYFSDGTDWYTVSTGADYALDEMGAANVADSFFAELATFRKAGEESLEGGKALRYEGRLQGENLLAMLEINGLLSGIYSMSENQQNKIRENLIKDLKPLSLNIWIDAESGYPVRFEVSMEQTLEQLAASIANTLGNKASEEESEVSKYGITMSLSEFDAVEEIVLPPEAAKALPFEAAAGAEA